MLNKLLSTFGLSKPKVANHGTDYDRTMDDFVTTWIGAFYELCTSEQIDEDVHFDDATETLYEGFQLFEGLTLERISNYTDLDVENLALAAKGFLEHDRLTEQHIRYLLEESLWHWEKRPKRPQYSDYITA